MANLFDHLHQCQYGRKCPHMGQDIRSNGDPDFIESETAHLCDHGRSCPHFADERPLAEATYDYFKAKDDHSKQLMDRDKTVRRNAGLRMAGKSDQQTKLGDRPKAPKRWVAYEKDGTYMGWVPVDPSEPESEALAYLSSNGMDGVVKLESRQWRGGLLESDECDCGACASCDRAAAEYNKQRAEAKKAQQQRQSAPQPVKEADEAFEKTGSKAYMAGVKAVRDDVWPRVREQLRNRWSGKNQEEFDRGVHNALADRYGGATYGFTQQKESTMWKSVLNVITETADAKMVKWIQNNHPSVKGIKWWPHDIKLAVLKAAYEKAGETFKEEEDSRPRYTYVLPDGREVSVIHDQDEIPKPVSTYTMGDGKVVIMRLKESVELTVSKPVGWDSIKSVRDFDVHMMLGSLNIDSMSDFYQLSSGQVNNLLALADKVGYRKPASANGSRARYFYEFLQRNTGTKSGEVNESILREGKEYANGWKVVKTITSHSGLFQWLSEFNGDEGGFVEKPKDIPSPYRYSRYTEVHRKAGKNYIYSEVSHKRYEVIEIPSGVTILGQDPDNPLADSLKEAVAIDWNAKAAYARTLTKDELLFAINDCIEAGRALGNGPQFGKDQGYYHDEASIYRAEITRREKKLKPGECYECGQRGSHDKYCRNGKRNPISEAWDNLPQPTKYTHIPTGRAGGQSVVSTLCGRRADWFRGCAPTYAQATCPKCREKAGIPQVIQPGALTIQHDVVESV